MSFFKGLWKKDKEETNPRPPAPNEFTPKEEAKSQSIAQPMGNMFSGMAMKPRVKPNAFNSENETPKKEEEQEESVEIPLPKPKVIFSLLMTEEGIWVH